MDAVTKREFDHLSLQVQGMDDKLDVHTQQEVRMDERLQNLEKDVADIKKDIRLLLEIWTQSKGAMKFLSIAVAVLASGWTAIMWIKDHIHV